jgi:hypothetical protein
MPVSAHHVALWPKHTITQALNRANVNDMRGNVLVWWKHSGVGVVGRAPNDRAKVLPKLEAANHRAVVEHACHRCVGACCGKQNGFNGQRAISKVHAPDECNSPGGCPHLAGHGDIGIGERVVDARNVNTKGNVWQRNGMRFAKWIGDPRTRLIAVGIALLEDHRPSLGEACDKQELGLNWAHERGGGCGVREYGWAATARSIGWAHTEGASHKSGAVDACAFAQ